MQTGRIFDIQHFGVHDGPGIRTLVFLKGCPLHCDWCCNPESQYPEEQIRYFEAKCKGCFDCSQVCPYQAITPKESTTTSLGMTTNRVERTIQIDFEQCKECSAKPCLDACNHGALTRTGYSIGSDQLMEIVKKDIAFYRNSGGGVTFTGGEPLAQPEFLIEMLEKCKDSGIHAAIETCGYGSTADLQRITPLTDLFLFDLKLINPELHLKFTGKPNSVILENLAWLSAQDVKIIIRFPLIPGITDTDENIKDVISLMKKLGLTEINLEPWHSMGEPKYHELGITNKFDGFAADSAYSEERLKQIGELFSPHFHNIFNY